jgi:hypothetical protein
LILLNEGKTMKQADNRDAGFRVFIAAAVCLAASGMAQAKGYSPNSAAPDTDSQDVERRLNRIEDHQRKVEEAFTAELQKLRAELKDAKGQHTARVSVESAD